MKFSWTNACKWQTVRATRCVPRTCFACSTPHTRDSRPHCTHAGYTTEVFLDIYGYSTDDCTGEPTYSVTTAALSQAPNSVCYDSHAVLACTNTCSYPSDGDCDDGGPGSEYSNCYLGTDCVDCGSRDSSLGVDSGSIRNYYIDPSESPLVYRRVFYPDANDCTGSSVTEVLGTGDCSSTSRQRFYPRIREVVSATPSSLSDFQSIAFRFEDAVVPNETSKYSGSVDWSGLETASDEGSFFQFSPSIGAKLEYRVGDYGTLLRHRVVPRPSRVLALHFLRFLRVQAAQH